MRNSRVQDTVKMTIYGREVTMTEYYDGYLLAEWHEATHDRWFVMWSYNKGLFQVQENLSDGNIVEMYTDTNLCAALAHLALADHWQPQANF